MNRTTRRLAAFTLALLAPLLAATAAAKPNILLILPDEMRASAMGCDGNRILGGYARKLMLASGFQCVARGHHTMPNEGLFARTGRVLHYKWNSAVLDHLAERLALREQTGYQWGHESERFLAYWQKNGRFVFADCI